ncbi:MAG: HyaD/HybD family hydrogenase maturation endopeptidase [Thiogranum sp.]
MNENSDLVGLGVPGSTLILGLGNTLLGDEGVGVKTVSYLQNTKPVLQSVEMLDGGTLSFILAGPIEDSEHLIVIDAAQLNKAPGSVHLYEGKEMDQFVMRNKHNSVHEVSLSDLLAIAYLSGQLPQRRALIGIQPERIDWSDTLTDSVAQSIPVACDLVHELLMRWRQEVGEAEAG